jgi:hypothetical protein
LVLYGRKSTRDSGGSENLSYHGKKVPRNGCRGEAIRIMNKGHEYPAGSQAASEIANSSYTVSPQDPGATGVTRKWSACMKRKGYSYATPLAPIGDNAFLGPDISRRGKATAQADIACKKSTGLLDVWFSAESDIQAEMIDERLKILTRLQDVHAAKVAAARKIIARLTASSAERACAERVVRARSSCPFPARGPARSGT